VKNGPLAKAQEKAQTKNRTKQESLHFIIIYSSSSSSSSFITISNKNPIPTQTQRHFTTTTPKTTFKPFNHGRTRFTRLGTRRPPQKSSHRRCQKG